MRFKVVQVVRVVAFGALERGLPLGLAGDCDGGLNQSATMPGS